MGLGGGWPGLGGASLPWQPNGMNFPGRPARAQGSSYGDSAAEGDGSAGKQKKARFPLKAALTAGALATTGDTVAQLLDRWKKQKALEKQASVELLELAGGRLQQVIGRSLFCSSIKQMA